MKPRYQQQKAWFGTNEGCPLSSDERLLRVNPASVICPVHRFTGDKEVLAPLLTAAFDAWGRYNHQCSQHFSLFGSHDACCEVAQLFAETIDLPFVRIDSEQVQIANHILVKIAEVLERTPIIHEVHGPVTLELVPYGEDRRYFVLPPCVVFVDDIDLLNRNVLPRLLRAMSPSQPMLCTEKGWTANCFNVCWLVRGESQLPRFVERTFQKIVLEAKEAHAL